MSSVTFAAYQRQVEPTPGHSHHAEPMAASLALTDDGRPRADCRSLNAHWRSLNAPSSGGSAIGGAMAIIAMASAKP